MREVAPAHDRKPLSRELIMRASQLGESFRRVVFAQVRISALNTAFTAVYLLVVIHKLEYFLNARIIGTQIRAQAWELLLAMLAMEAAFGLAGVVAAPIYYAYLKQELADRQLV